MNVGRGGKGKRRGRREERRGEEGEGWKETRGGRGTNFPGD